MANLNYHWSLDLETLGTQNGSVIASLALVNIGRPSVYIHHVFDIGDQTNRSIDMGALKWWLKQDKAVIDSTFNQEPTSDLYSALMEVRNMLGDAYAVWQLGSMDVDILNHAWNQLNNAPGSQDDFLIKFWCAKDARTLFNLHKGFEREYAKDEHDVLSDARQLGHNLRKWFNQFKVVPA